MPLKLVFLGTGEVCTNFRENEPNNAAVFTEEGLVLLGCGSTAIPSMKELGLSAQDVRGVVIPQLRSDHLGGIEPLLRARHILRPDLPNIGIFLAEPLHQLLGELLKNCEGYDTHVDPALTCGGVHFELDSPYGVRIQAAEQGPYYYTSDTAFRENLVELFPDVRVIFHACTFSPKYPGTSHTHYEKLLTLPVEVRNRIVLRPYSRIPEGVSPRKDGFLWTAKPHDSFVLGESKLTISGPHGGAVYRVDAGQWKREASIRVG